MIKKLRSVAIILILTCTLCGCDRQIVSDKEPIVLTMWHNYGGEMQDAVDSLIDEFNATVGKKEGIVITVTAIASNDSMHRAMQMIANGDPGAPATPDIFTGYPKTALLLQQKDMLVDLNEYISSDTLALYVDDYVKEGQLPDGGLFVFPASKSTEVLYLNKTLFDEFARDTGADIKQLETFEGIASLAEKYYAWSGGKQFFSVDSWFNFSQIGMRQTGQWFFNLQKESLDVDSENFRRILQTIYEPVTRGGFNIMQTSASDLFNTGDVVCSIGSSTGIIFYNSYTISADGSRQEIDLSILPYPTFEGGEKKALLRGGGLMVTKSTPQKEKAAATFIQWFTDQQQNTRFALKTGYLPVTKAAYNGDFDKKIAEIENKAILNLLQTSMEMYRTYELFPVPNTPSFSEKSENFESQFLRILQEANASGNRLSPDDVLQMLLNANI